MYHSEGVRPFKLVKYFAYTSFSLILISSLALSFVISKGARKLILKKSEDYAFLVAENLNHQVFLHFTLPTVAIFGRIKLRERAQFERMDRVVRNTIHGFNIKQVNIYDIKGKIAYSTDKKLIGKKMPVPPEFEQAKKGKLSYRLEGNVLKTYAPFMAERGLVKDPSMVLGIFEIIQDLKKDYQSITDFQRTVVLSSVLIMGFLFIGLTLIVRRAERIIEERTEEKRKLEEQLRQAEHLANIGQMVAAISHELRNPLGVVSSTAELLKSREKENPTNAQLSQIILEEAKRANQVLSEFLEFARPRLPKLSSCEITAILDKVLTFLGPEFKSQQIEIVKDYKDKPIINADAELLYRAFSNIVLNAIQAMPKGGRLKVEVNTNPKEEKVIITFSDTGIGIPEDVLEKIFTPFFSTKEKGTGLGLAIVKKIIENHHGRIKIESEINKGTKVIIWLPY